MPTAIYTPRVVVANRRHKDDRDIRIAHHGWFASWKLNSNIPYRGLLRFDFLCAAECHPDVAFTSNHVEPIDWFNRSEWVQYYPRFTVALRQGGREVERYVDVEVLYSGQYRRERANFDRIRRAYRQAGRKLLVVTERQLNVEPRRTNYKLLLSHAGDGIVSQQDKELIRKVASSTKTFSINELVSVGVLTYHKAYSIVLNLAASGELVFQMGRLFDGETRVGRRGR